MKIKKKEKRVTPLQKIAMERMYRLIELAEKEWPEHPKRSQRYIQLIRQFSTRIRVTIPPEIKTRFCKKCGNYWKEGVTVTRRIKGNTLNSNCVICHSLSRKRLSHVGKKETDNNPRKEK